MEWIVSARPGDSSRARLRTIAGDPPARLLMSAFLGVVLGMTGYYAAFTVAPLIAEDLTGSRTWSGLPGAAVILGTACGAVLLSEVMQRHGRRPGLTLGWLAGTAGALLAVVATVTSRFLLLVTAMLVLGLGHGANQLARFAAADTRPRHRQGRVLSLVVWAGTIGAVAGPVVLEPAAAVATLLGLDPLVGGLLVAAGVFAVAGCVCAAAMRPDPQRFATPEHAGSPVAGRVGRGGAPRLDRQTVTAVFALVTTQFVMLLVMTVTPVHVRGHAHGLSGVGVVIGLHVFGMFGLAPVAGWASDRFGALRVALVGLVLVAASATGAALAPPLNLTAVSASLFGLGLGWSAAFVASSTLLARCGARVQGRADALGWGFAAIASLTSGLLLATLGYSALATAGAALALVAAGVVAVTMRRESSRATPGCR